jgi:hypothetical protein
MKVLKFLKKNLQAVVSFVVSVCTSKTVKENAKTDL